MIEALTRLELSDNKISSIAECKFPAALATIKLANNHLSNWDETLGKLKELKELKNVDISSNKFKEGHEELLWKEIASLEVVDGKDKEGKEVDSEDEFSEDEDGDEQGESDMSDDDEMGESDLSGEESAAGESATAAEETTDKKVVSTGKDVPADGETEKR